MSSDLVESDAINIVKGFCQSGSTDVVRRTGFKLERQFVEGSLFKRDVLNHFSSSLIRGHTVQPFFLSIKHTDTCRAVNLMCGEHQEIGIQVLHIHLHVGDRLCSIH